MSHRRHRGDRTPLNADINVVSLIDVMMLLMVIFMITAPIMQGGVDVSLPKVEAKPLESKSGLVVSVTADGRIFVDETVMSFADFKASFPMFARKQGKDGVYLRADERARYGTVVEVLAVMRAAGAANVGLVAEPETIQK